MFHTFRHLSALLLSPCLVMAADAEPTHWALKPVTRPVVPAVNTNGWARNPIDAFIWRRLRKAGLTPSPGADRHTLIRRGSFDLLGLPPAHKRPRDTSSSNRSRWASVVDRLLSSPHYGERWGRHWLDVARYADTKGYVFFEDRSFPWAWTYRDYVVRSFNDDLPYNRFVLEQLAADQLDLDSRPASRAAMGFLTLSPRFMNNLHDQIDDQIDVVTRGLLGLTVTCARCHDHKYDPIPQADYYSLYGVFRSSSEPLVPPELSRPANTEQQRKFQAELEKRSKAIRQFIIKTHADMQVAARKRAAEYLLQAQRTLAQPPTDNFMLLTEAGGLNPSIVLKWRVYLEELEAASLVENTRNPVWGAWHELARLDDGAPESYAQALPALLERLTTTPASSPPTNPLVLAALKANPPGSLDAAAAVYGEVLSSVEAQWQAVTSDAVKKGSPPPVGFKDPAREELRLIFHAPDAPANIPRLFGWGALALLPDRPAQGVYKKLRKELETWLIKGNDAPPRAMTLAEDDSPFQPRVFQRGNPNRLGDPVPRQLPAAIASGPRTPFQLRSGRLELAREIAAPTNPLTSRVLVNRIWLHHFGDGLVRTPSDFGTRGAPPTHPELLDYLADWFSTDAGWSIKALHRLIMTSATYRQRSDHRPSAFATDPENRLLWRMSRRRLGFEAMRDSQLSYANSLDSQIGGTPLGNMFTGGGLSTRRSIYGHIDRMNPASLLRTFDVPSPQASCGRRDETTVAPQALHMMNHATLHELAARLAARTSGTGPQRTQALFRIVLSRPPEAAELSAILDFVAKFDGTPIDSWIAVSHALLMSNEAQFID
ncbi:MAG: DUF1553 domain-containing protein [Planctomycetota bacterium]|nr:DUF1553 domain-containing protein [Planctomycetota bacterium]